MHKVSTLQEVDTGGGFFLEEGEEGMDEDVVFAQLMQDGEFNVDHDSQITWCRRQRPAHRILI